MSLLGVGDNGNGARTGIRVLLCGDLRDALDLDALCARLVQDGSQSPPAIVRSLCHAPAEVSAALAGTAGAVLGLCSLDYAEAEMQSLARKAGLDPYGIESVNLGTIGARTPGHGQTVEKAALLLRGAVAKAGAHQGSIADSLVPYLAPMSQRVSRRALFTLPPLRYRVAASIDRERCTADRGCSLCAQACPRDALEWTAGRIRVEQARCEACGVCVGACPRDAVQLPGSSQAQLSAQLDALLRTDAPALPERRIAFFCRGAVADVQRASGDGVGPSEPRLPVVVPCVGMVSVACILQCLALGAVAVELTPCGAECPFGQDEAIRARVDYCRGLLAVLGGPDQSGRVRLVGSDGETAEETGALEVAGLPRPIHEAPSPGFFGPDAAARALLMLADEYDAPTDVAIRHPASPLGAVRVDARKCTACGLCAGACPTETLQFERDDGAIRLTLDPALCTGCGTCVGACPEAGAIAVERVTDLDALRWGRTAVYEDTEARCVACGAPVAPNAMLERVAALLGSEQATLSGYLRSYCPSCREGPPLP